ncbi:MAG TPA: MBL fold metallo-hydrolase [Vicinamibacterales bacterium]|nr:MBL fold metallo-hydrolase [Vicinamibacterales bacterium]
MANRRFTAKRLAGAAAALSVLIAGLAWTLIEAAPARSTLDFYFIDVEGGAATLVVTPAGESILIDSGFPGGRDAGRIARVVRDEARLARIDHYVTTHWHRDHVGGIAELAKLVPVRRHYGHRLPAPLSEDIPEPLVRSWQEIADDPVWLRAGDRLPLEAQPAVAGGGGPAVLVEVLAADGVVKGEPEGAPQTRACSLGHEPRPDDPTDNARSLAFHLSYGAFDLFAGGDLTWNVEHKLSCPAPLVPRVDAYLANHHGLDRSNNPALIDALDPTVAIVNNGPEKGGERRTIADLLKRLGPSRVFQLHRNVREGAVNTEPEFIANENADCDAAFLRLSVAPDGRRYAVSIPARNRSWTFEAR